jgi:hypothetical protein
VQPPLHDGAAAASIEKTQAHLHVNVERNLNRGFIWNVVSFYKEEIG